MNSYRIALCAISFLFFACNGNQPSQEAEGGLPEFQNEGHEIIYQMVSKVGDYNQLQQKKDVVYTYTYTTPDGKADVSTEKYLFDGELSYGHYHQHERTLPQFEGPIEQGYDGETYWLKHHGQEITDSAALKRVAFNRPTNFYWFTMFQKLMDPGLNYEYLGEEQRANETYDVVKITFNSNDDQPTDSYQLYINKTTLLTDQFLFTVVDYGVVETPFLMQLEYETIDGMLLPTKRRYKKSSWKAEVTEDPWITVRWSDIKFNTGLTPADFEL